MKAKKEIETNLDQTNLIIEEIQPSSDDSMWSVGKVAEYLSLSKPAIYSLARQRQIPHYRPIPNGKIIFRRSEIDIWLLDSKVEVEKKNSWSEEEQREFIRARLG